MSDDNELERLRARVAELEAELSSPRPARRATGTSHTVWRSTSAAILIMVACLLAPLSVTAVWASTQVSDTEQYVETVAPLADDPAVQQAVADDVTRVVLDYVEVEELTDQTLAALAQQENLPPRVAEALPALAVPITNGIESFTRTQVDNIVASDRFATAWEQVNRIAHEQVVRLLEGNQGGAISAQDDTVTLNLAPVIAQVKERLVARGFTVAENIPEVDQSFVLVRSDAVTRAQGFYRLLNALGAWLSVIALALFALGVYLARDRRRALLRGALGVVGAMLALGVALAIARVLYLDAVPADVLPRQAAENVFDTLVRFLRTGLRAAAVLGLIVALGAFLTGPTNAAVWTRSKLSSGIGSLRGGAEAAGWQTGPVGTWTFAHKRALRIGVVIVGGLVLAFWTRPTAVVVVVTALLVLLAVGVVEFLGRPPSAPVAAAEGGEAPTPPLPRQMQRLPSEEEQPAVPEQGEAPTPTPPKEPTPHG